MGWGEKEGSGEMQVSQMPSPCPASRPGTSGKGEKALRGRAEPEFSGWWCPWASPPPAKPLLQALNTRNIPSRSCGVGSACPSLSPLGAGRRPAPPATSRVEQRRGGVRAPPTRPHPRDGDSHARCPRGQQPGPSQAGWGRTKKEPSEGATEKKLPRGR